MSLIILVTLMFSIVTDINRIAAVVQAVMAKDGEIFGGWPFVLRL
jgi:hypothetical protein